MCLLLLMPSLNCSEACDSAHSIVEILYEYRNDWSDKWYILANGKKRSQLTAVRRNTNIILAVILNNQKLSNHSEHIAEFSYFWIALIIKNVKHYRNMYIQIIKKNGAIDIYFQRKSINIQHTVGDIHPITMIIMIN